MCTAPLAFDLDGTLVNTRDAVTAAYRLAGVEMPESAWGRRWEEWLPALTSNPEKVHEDKTRMYVDAIRKAPPSPTPLMDHCFRLEACKTPYTILTAASRQAAWAIVGAFNLSHAVVGAELDRRAKLDYLSNTEPGLYFDDDPITVACVNDMTRWTGVCVTW